MAVAPALLTNPAFDALLLSFLILCGCIVAAGIIYVLHGFVRATVGGIAGLLGKLPGVGFIVASPVNAVYHWMNAEFGAVEAALDRRISQYFHQLAKLILWVGEEIKAHANLLYLLSTILLGSTLTAALSKLVALARSEIKVVRHRIDHLAAAIVKPIQGELRALERWTYPRVKALEREVGREIPKDIAGLRARTRSIEGELSNLWDYVRTHPWTAVTDAFVGAVAIALTRLGLEWVKCDSAKSFFRRHGCNGWNRLESLLGLVAEVALITNICRVLPWLEEGFSLVAAPLIGTLTEVGAGLCGPGSGRAPALGVPTLHLPATVDASLHLA